MQQEEPVDLAFKRRDVARPVVRQVDRLMDNGRDYEPADADKKDQEYREDEPDRREPRHASLKPADDWVQQHGENPADNKRSDDLYGGPEQAPDPIRHRRH